MDRIEYKQLILRNHNDKAYTIVSSEEALTDVIPIKWDEDVVSGEKRILLMDKK